MRGDDARRVPEALNANGFALAPDGIYAHFTEALVRQFQSRSSFAATASSGR